MRLTPAQQQLLKAMAAGAILKAHRYLDGRKVYQLHPPTGELVPVRATTVQALAARGLIDSNKKFPAAMYWLTPVGREAASALPALVAKRRG